MGATWSFDVQGTPLTVYGVYQDGKPKLASKLITDGRHTSFINGGKFYSTRATGGSVYYGRRWQRHLALVKDAIALGVLPKGNLLRVAKIEEARRAREAAAYSAREAIRGAAEAGVKLPASTLKALKRKARKP
jgi:hypothetical protein